MRKNVIFITPCFGYGGLEQVVLNIIETIDRSKFNISFCTLIEPHSEMIKRIQNQNISWYTLKKRDGVDLTIPLKLAYIIKKEKVDLINSHDVGSTLYAAIAAMMGKNRKIIHTDHSQILTKKKYFKIIRYILKNSVSFTITVSNDLKDYFINKVGIEHHKIETIPNGIDTDKFKRSTMSQKIKNELNLRNKDYIIGSVGRLTEQKGYEYLLKAIHIVLKDKENIRLIIAGDGELKSNLEKLANELKIRDKVVFAGNRQDIPDLLKIFDVFVLSSLWEGQPMSIIEAMAAEKPIIVTNVGGNKEILGHGEYGVLVEPRNSEALAHAIRKLFEDKVLAMKIAKQAASIVDLRLSRNIMTARYEQIFSYVINQ